jgi:hypothetical protein
MRESQQFFFGGRLVSILFEELQDPVIKTKIVLHFGGIFHQIKVHPANRKKGFFTNRVLKKQEAGGIFCI